MALEPDADEPFVISEDLDSLHNARLDYELRTVLADLALFGRVSMVERLDEALQEYQLRVVGGDRASYL